jgi:hypothetical protein
MSVERYEIKLSSQRVAAVDLADSPDHGARFTAIANALRRLGASSITNHTFVLPAADVCSIADLQSVLNDLFIGGDQMLVVGDVGQGIAGTALICADTKEGVSVRKSPPGLGIDGGDGCAPSGIAYEIAANQA